MLTGQPCYDSTIDGRKHQKVEFMFEKDIARTIMDFDTELDLDRETKIKLAHQLFINRRAEVIKLPIDGYEVDDICEMLMCLPEKYRYTKDESKYDNIDFDKDLARDLILLGASSGVEWFLMDFIDQVWEEFVGKKNV